MTKELQNYFGYEILGTNVANYLKASIPFTPMKSPTQLDFPDGYFDVGLFIDVLHHIAYNQQANFIQEAARTCKTVLIIDAKPTWLAFFFDRVLNWFHNKDMPLTLSFREPTVWAESITCTGLTCSITELKRPFALYPFENFLLRVERS